MSPSRTPSTIGQWNLRRTLVIERKNLLDQEPSFAPRNNICPSLHLYSVTPVVIARIDKGVIILYSKATQRFVPNNSTCIGTIARNVFSSQSVTTRPFVRILSRVGAQFLVGVSLLFSARAVAPQRDVFSDLS